LGGFRAGLEVSGSRTLRAPEGRERNRPYPAGEAAAVGRGGRGDWVASTYNDTGTSGPGPEVFAEFWAGRLATAWRSRGSPRRRQCCAGGPPGSRWTSSPRPGAGRSAPIGRFRRLMIGYRRRQSAAIGRPGGDPGTGTTDGEQAGNSPIKPRRICTWRQRWRGRPWRPISRRTSRLPGRPWTPPALEAIDRPFFRSSDGMIDDTPTPARSDARSGAANLHRG